MELRYVPFAFDRSRGRYLYCVRRLRPARQSVERDRRGRSQPRDAGLNLLDGHYEEPVRIVAFNTVEGWSRDVTVEIADEVRRRFIEQEDTPASLLRFLDSANRH